jgi:succinyl-CoA synthetase beta subunit
MNIHEYQAKAVLHEFGVPVPRGVPAFSVEEALKGAQDLGGPVWVVKAQIHAGGRGKAGGVKVVKSIDDENEFARILGSSRDASDRPARKESQPPLYRRGLGDRSQFYCRR